jgi:hypothetical protein
MAKAREDVRARSAFLKSRKIAAGTSELRPASAFQVDGFAPLLVRHPLSCSCDSFSQPGMSNSRAAADFNASARSKPSIDLSESEDLFDPNATLVSSGQEHSGKHHHRHSSADDSDLAAVQNNNFLENELFSDDDVSFY